MLFLMVQCFLIAYLVHHIKCHLIVVDSKKKIHSVSAVILSSYVNFSLSFKNFSISL